MDLDNVSDWIEHINNPLVLLGFVFIIFAGLIKFFKPQKLNGQATERLMNRALTFLFLLGVFVISFILLDSLLTKKTSDNSSNQDIEDNTERASDNISSQTVKGNSGTVIQSGGDIFHNQGDGTFSVKSNAPAQAETAIKQTVEDNQGKVYLYRPE